MSTCDECGKQENMPYHCRHCGGTFCAEHRLPENHDCPGLDSWNDPGGVFDSGFDDSVSTSSSSSSDGLAARLGINTGPGSIFSYFRGNMTYVFLGLMWITFFAQQVFLNFVVGLDRFGRVEDPEMFRLYESIFILSAEHPEYVWTWFTSIFSHSTATLWHIAGNSIWIFFFGRIVEKYIGSRDFTLLFLASGALAGLGQIVIGIIEGTGGGVLGASGAGLAIGGVLVVLNPNLRVFIWGILPMPMWAIVGFYAALSAFGLLGVGVSNVANVAHLVGLAIGIVYGQRVKNKISTPGTLRFGGGGPGGPGGPGGRRRGPF